MIFNISKLSDEVTKVKGGNTYSYVKMKKLMSGITGDVTNKEIDQIIQVIKQESSSMINFLQSLKK